VGDADSTGLELELVVGEGDHELLVLDDMLESK
jgi:hypothetical protein